MMLSLRSRCFIGLRVREANAAGSSDETTNTIGDVIVYLGPTHTGVPRVASDQESLLPNSLDFRNVSPPSNHFFVSGSSGSDD